MNINGDVTCQSVNWPLVTPRHKRFRQNRTHLTTYVRLENKLKGQSIALHSLLFEIPHHKIGFMRQWQIYPFWILFKADIVGDARATENPHNICLPEPQVPIMKFPTCGHGDMKCVNNDYLNYCDQPWRSIRRQEIIKHDHINYCDKTWRSFRRLAITHLIDKTYCNKMLAEVFVIIIYVNKYAMTTCNEASCQTRLKETWWHVQITTKFVDLNLCEKEWRSVRRQEICKHDHLNYRYKTGHGRVRVCSR